MSLRPEYRVHPAPGAPRPSSGFDAQSLNVLNYARGFTLWHYRSRYHVLEQLMGPNFFGEAHNLVEVGDIIMLVGTDGAQMVMVKARDFQVVSLCPMACRGTCS